tara:strand:+ start:690 stop:1268 length:579 start_codon:yes stop_codon:yes gene_type:complete
MPLSTIAANQIKNDTIVDAKINSSANIATTKLGTGAIIQTQKTVITTPFTIALSTNTDTTVTGMTVNITPSFSNSIILLTGQIMGEHTHPHNLMFTFFRDSTKLGQPAGGNRNVGIAPFPNTYHSDAASTSEFVNFQHHDTPSTTSQITYKITGNTSATSSTTLFVNKTITDSNADSMERGMSFIMAQEIKV